jgi:hypothetical protein
MIPSPTWNSEGNRRLSTYPPSLRGVEAQPRVRSLPAIVRSLREMLHGEQFAVRPAELPLDPAVPDLVGHLRLPGFLELPSL